jgi:hypothetical protein
MPFNASAAEPLPFEPLRLPPLFRSEGFAEDLPDPPALCGTPSAASGTALRRNAGVWLWTAPLVLGLIGAAASVLA